MTDTPDAPDPDAQASEPSIDAVLAEEPREVSAEGIGEEGTDGTRALALTTREANALNARRRPTVLVLAGGVKCGKTSVYAAIYERLSRGPFAGRVFAGSATIPGFEARCYYWRTSSGLASPAMKHTQAPDLPWLHLRLRDVELEHAPADLLFGDFDGEFFEQLIKNEVQPAELPFLHRADHVGVVVDGERISNPETRAAEIQDLEYLADALMKDERWAPPSLLFVITKLDLIDGVASSDERARIEDALANLHDRLRGVGGADVPIIRLAVRSETDRFPLGHGLESLLELLDARSVSVFESKPQPLAGRGPLAGFHA